MERSENITDCTMRTDPRHISWCKEADNAITPVTPHGQQTTDGLLVWLTEVALPWVDISDCLLTVLAGKSANTQRAIDSEYMTHSKHKLAVIMVIMITMTQMMMINNHISSSNNNNIIIILIPSRVWKYIGSFIVSKQADFY